MANFAKVLNGVVQNVIVAEPDFFDTFIDNSPGEWIQTSYNTKAGVHPEGRPLRKNFAAIGFMYDRERDAFIPPQPHPSWLLNEDTCLWKAPSDYPDNGNMYHWNEENETWDEVIEP
jgi:hypothetical protein